MKNRTILFALGLAALLAVSLFSYKSSETIIHSAERSTTSGWSADGAALATVILSIALFSVGRRISRAVSVASQRAGLPTALPVPIACRIAIAAAVPFLMFGRQSTSAHDSIQITFGFGVSPYKIPAFLLAILLVWLVALLQRLRALSERIANQSNSNATENA